MKQHILEIAWIVAIASLVVMVVYVISRPGLRAFAKSVWKAQGFRWVLYLFLLATSVLLIARLLQKLGL